MATDIETLLVRLEASAAGFEKQISRARQQGDSQLSAIEKRFAAANRGVSAQMTALSDAAKATAAALASALAVGEIGRLADEWQGAFNKIAATGLSPAAASAAREAIVGIADRARTGFPEVADLYARLSRAGQTFGATQGQVAIATEVVAKALKVTGASAGETESTLVQLGQALTSGKLQGDELRSLKENAPVVAAAIAREFGVAVGQLKDLGAEGALTSDRVFKAIVNAQKDVETAFAATTPTIADAFARLKTAALAYVGASTQVGTVSRGLGAALGGVAGNFDLVANGAAALGLIVASRLVAGGLVPAVAAFGASIVAAQGSAAALTVASAAASRFGLVATAAAAGSRALAVAMALLGGPVGLAIFGAAAAATYLAGRFTEGVQPAKGYAQALADVEASSGRARQKIDEVAASVQRADDKLRQATAAKLGADLLIVEANANRAARTLLGLADQFERGNSMQIDPAQKTQALNDIRTVATGTAEEAVKARDRLEDLGQVNPNFGSFFASMQSVIARLIAGRAHASALRAELSGLGAAQVEAYDKSIRDRIPNPTAGTSYASDSAIAGGDPVLRGLRGQGIAQRALADAEMDKTAKKIRDKERELRKEIYDKGGIIPDNIGAIAKRMVDAEGGGGGGGGRGGKGGGAAKQSELQQELQSSAQRIEALRREQQALGLTAYEAAKLEEKNRLLDAAKKDGKDLSPQVVASIDAQSEAYARQKQALEEAKAAQQAYKDLQTFVGQSISGFFSDIVSGGRNASEALMNLTKKLADAALQAALLGSGPLAGLFGLKGQNGGAGGLVGMLFGGLKFGGGGGGGFGLPQLYAEGGYTGPGGKHTPAGLVHAGEFVMSQEAVKRLGLRNLMALHELGTRGYAAGGPVGMSVPALPSLAPRRPAAPTPVALTVSVVGANGDAQIQRMVAAGVKSGMEQTMQAVRRNFLTLSQEAQMRYGGAV